MFLLRRAVLSPMKHIAKVTGFLVVCLFLTQGCALKLFEFPLDKETLKQASEKTRDTETLGLVEVLKARPSYRLEETIDRSGKKRLIRRDLQDFIDREWLKGRNYLNKMDLKLYAIDIKGKGGIIVPKKLLARFEPDIPITYHKYNNPGVKLSFIHLSDLQLRDERVYMFNKKLTEFGDYISDGFQHEPGMIFYDYSYYLSQIGLMNRFQELLSTKERPLFMIHTGDSLHMGVVSELYEFIYMTNKLNIPWYNALGNHDYQVYGNLDSKDVGVIKPNMGFQTVNSRYNFINLHGGGFHVDKQVYFSPDNAPDDNTTLETRSVFNGFDRTGKTFSEQGRLRERLNKPCKNCPGYYHFEITEPKNGDPGILAVVLDTTTKDFKFARGTLYRHKETKDHPDEKRRFEQINWLHDVLEAYARKGNWMVLAFGHHALNPKSFFDKSYKEAIRLFNNPKYNVVAYFCGHSHEHVVTYHKNSHNAETFGFWEIKTDSIMEYPKKGSLVNIVCTDEGYWEITLQSFWPYILDTLPDDAPAMLKNAKKCLEASKDDREGKKKRSRYSKLDPKNHDVVLRFSFPKTK